MFHSYPYRFEDLIFSAVPTGRFASHLPPKGDWRPSLLLRFFQIRQPSGVTHSCTWSLHQFQATISIEKVAIGNECKIKWQKDPLRAKTTAPTMKTTSPNSGWDLPWSVRRKTWSRKLETNLRQSPGSEALVQHPAFVRVQKRLLEKEQEPKTHREEGAQTLPSN